MVIYETLSTFRWRFNKNVTCSIPYETEDNLLEWGGCSIHLPLGHCASLIHATRKFFLIHYLLEMISHMSDFSLAATAA